MTTGELIVARLRASTAVTAIVVNRIFPAVAPQGAAAPRIVYTVVSDVPQNTLDGSAETRLRQIRLQVDCYAAKYVDAENLADAVDAVIGNLDAPGLSAWRENSTSLYDDEAELHRIMQEYTVWR